MEDLLFLILAFGLQCTNGKISVVKTCPETKAAWDRRSSIFTCVNKDTKYHCIMTSTLILVEACITPLNISGKGENADGCPTVYLYKSKAYWMFPFTPCSAQNAECPRKGNGDYFTDQLFKYPACFLNISERASGGTNVQQTTKPTSNKRVSTSCEPFENFCRYDVINLKYFSYGITLLMVVLLIAVIQLNRLNRNIFKEVTDQIKQISETDSRSVASTDAVSTDFAISATS